VALAILQGTGLVATARSGALFSGCTVATSIVPDRAIFTTITMVVTMTAGTGVVMWLGELITDRGIGNGMSILMFISIAATFPSALWTIKKQGTLAGGWIEFGTVILVGLVMVGLVVFVEQAQRRIPVQYAKRMIGRRSYGGTSTYIPLKVNQAGVIPVIFASSLLYIPALVAQFSGGTSTWKTWIQTNLTKGDHPIYLVSYFLLIVFFAFFYVAISFNPEEVADNMKKYGGFIPGIRAGRPTAEYLSYVLNRITWPGSLYLGLIALVPTMALVGFNASGNFPFGGTSILIIVGVGLETVKQIESQLQQRNYEGFLR
jgi:preprotein translocase subunit SecY